STIPVDGTTVAFTNARKGQFTVTKNWVMGESGAVRMADEIFLASHVGIYNGEAKLEAGKDYTRTGNTFTLNDPAILLSALHVAELDDAGAAVADGGLINLAGTDQKTWTYKVGYPNSGTITDGVVTITNTVQPIKVTKVWEGTGVHPTEVRIALGGKTVTLNDGNKWTQDVYLPVDTYAVTENGTAVNGGQVKLDGLYYGASLAISEDRLGYTVTNERNPKLAVEKTASKPKDGAFKLGDRITYSVTVKNTGDVTLERIVVTDSKMPAGEQTIASLAPDVSKTITYKYKVTEADIAAGTTLTNTATAASKTAAGEVDAQASGTNNATLVKKNEALGITKEITNAKTDEAFKLGETIKYKIVVTNEGNQTLQKDVVVTDDKRP
ncbi:MAG: hypothetical protein RR739_11200, partial [Clostridia bacterium]